MPEDAPGKVMYHATLFERWSEISKGGLKPRSLPPALTREVGLTKGLYVGDLLFVRGYAAGEAESMFDLGEAEPPIDMAILRIHIPESTRLINDPNFPGEEAYITDAFIPSEDIELTDTVRFSLSGKSNPTLAGTCYPDAWLYHATTYDTYHNQIKNYGIVPQPLTNDVAAIVGFRSGIYLANSVEAAKDLAMLKYGESKYVVLHIKLPASTQLEIDPEIGEPDSPWFITPSIIPPENVAILNVGGQAPAGTCYQDAWRHVMQHTNENPVLVHGTTVTVSGRLGHAWVEYPDSTVWEPTSQMIFAKDKFYSLVDPIVDDWYTADEAASMLNVGYHGPWTAEERMKHIGR